MKENLVEYEVSYFKKNWKELLKIRIKGYKISDYIRYTMINNSNLSYRNDIGKPGIYNTGNKFDNKGRSLINYADTNYRSFTTLVNWLNEQVVHGNMNDITQIDFYLGSYQHEITKIFDILDNYGKFIFDPNSTIFTEMIKVIRGTSDYGNLIEDKTIEKLKTVKGITDVKKGGFGDKEDMFDGVDVTFVYNSKKWTIQCKSFVDLKYNDNYFYVKGIGHAKKYDPKKVNLFVFYNKKYGLLMFKNDDSVIIRPNEYIFNKNLKKNF